MKVHVPLCDWFWSKHVYMPATFEPLWRFRWKSACRLTITRFADSSTSPFGLCGAPHVFLHLMQHIWARIHAYACHIPYIIWHHWRIRSHFMITFRSLWFPTCFSYQASKALLLFCTIRASQPKFHVHIARKLPVLIGSGFPVWKGLSCSTIRLRQKIFLSGRFRDFGSQSFLGRSGARCRGL